MESIADQMDADSSETGSDVARTQTTEEQRVQSEPINNNAENRSGISATSSNPQELDVISHVVPSKERLDSIDLRTLKLRSKSSLSTAALTPVCSSRSQISLSPQQDGRRRLDVIEPKDIHSNKLV